MAKKHRRGTQAKAPEATAESMVGRNPGDKVLGDSLLVTCRKQKGWTTGEPTGQHNRWSTVAKKDAVAIVLSGYTNIRQ